MQAFIEEQMISTPQEEPGNTGPSEWKNWSPENWCFQGKVCNYSEILEKWWIKKARAQRSSVKHALQKRVFREKGECAKRPLPQQ